VSEFNGNEKRKRLISQSETYLSVLLPLRAGPYESI